jgi:ABC-type branched-subunit amino acid transport system ATPase component
MSTPEPEPAEAVLRLEEVSRAFGPVIALDEVNLSVQRGEIFGIIGRSDADPHPERTGAG